MLNKDIFPPDADITYESFLDKAKQETDSSVFVSVISLVIKIPLDGCHNWGETLAVACIIKIPLSNDIYLSLWYWWWSKVVIAYFSTWIAFTPLPFPE